MQRIAIVSEHASPLAQLGGADSGGQNVYVANVARALARQGHCVDVFTRLDDACLSGQMEWEDNVRVIHVPAGPACRLPKESLLPYMGQFAEFMQAYVREHAVQYDVIHANFFMSAMAALPLARETHTPLAVTFHALGKVRRLHQAHNDRFSDRALIAAAEVCGDAETKRVCEQILVQEEAMAQWLAERLPDTVRKFLVRDELPDTTAKH